MNLTLLGIVLIFVLFIGFCTWKAPRLTSIIWWALVATIFFSAALLLTLPGPFSEKALWVALSVPLIWVMFQFWCYWDARKWRVVGGLITISIVSSIIVFTTEPVV